MKKIGNGRSIFFLAFEADPPSERCIKHIDVFQSSSTIALGAHHFFRRIKSRAIASFLKSQDHHPLTHLLSSLQGVTGNSGNKRACDNSSSKVTRNCPKKFRGARLVKVRSSFGWPFSKKAHNQLILSWWILGSFWHGLLQDFCTVIPHCCPVSGSVLWQ